MGLRMKNGINPDVLRKYGFKPGKEWAEAGERCLEGIGYKYQHGWWHKFLMDEEYPEKIAYTDDENDIPMVQMAFRIGDRYRSDLHIDCAPCCTYHIGGSDLDVVACTIYDMVKDGILEKVED